MTAPAPRTVADLARVLGAELEGDGSRVVCGPAGLRDAKPDEVSFFADARYAPHLETTRAAAVVVARDQQVARADLALLRVANPERAFERLVDEFARPEPSPEPGIHPTAWVHPQARVAADARIGPGCVVERGARVAAGAVLRAQVFVGEDAVVGEGTYAHPGVVVGWRVVVGARCVLHAGCVLGSEGFGFKPAGRNVEVDGWTKVVQCGTVVVEDDVEIGANTTIDRARVGETRIGRGAKLDNLVHVAHNVVVGDHALLVAQVGVSGSSRIGAGAILAGQVGIAGHKTIGARVQIGAQSGVHSNIPDHGGDWFGTPARPLRESARDQSPGKRIQALRERVAALEAQVERLLAGRAAAEDAP